jgi:hypothetical protein
MARSVSQIYSSLCDFLVAAGASVGVAITPSLWSQTDYKRLTLSAISDGIGFEEQLNDAFISEVEGIVLTNPPQNQAWFRQKMFEFQFNSTTPQIPQITLDVYTNDRTGNKISILAIIWNLNVNYQIIKYCTVKYGVSNCLIKVAAQSNNLPVDLETAYPGSLAAVKSFINMVASPGITYVVTSGISDWLFLQVDVYYKGSYSATIFNDVSSAITTFLNGISYDGLFKLSSLETAILNVTGVDDLEFINVALRPDYNSFDGGVTSTFGTSLQQYLVSSTDQLGRNYNPASGYIAVENGTSTGTPSPVPNSQLGDFRVGSSGILNLNCIAI